MKGVRVSLGVKFSLISVILTLLILLSVFVFTGITVIGKSQSFMSEVLLKDTVRLLDFFSATVRDGLIADDDMLIMNTFDKVKKMDNVDYAILFNRSRTVLQHSEPFAGQGFNTNDRVFTTLFSQKKLVIQPPFDPADIRPSYTIAKPMFDGADAFIGLLAVKYSTRTLAALIYRIRTTLYTNMMLAVGGGTLLAVIFGIILAYIIVHPLRTMIHGTEIIGGGNLHHVIEVKHNDEMGVLADSFNTMTSRIRASQTALLEQKKQEEQMLIAHDIQESLYPEAPISRDTYEIASFSKPAKTVGGDYHYYRDMDNGMLYFILADVSGKGVPAALVTFMLATVSSMLMGRKSIRDSGTQITAMNRIVTSQMGKFGRFVTALSCIYDPKTKTIDFCSAGHGELAVYRGSDKHFEICGNSDIPIGLDKDKMYIGNKCVLAPGDHVLINSDGITEARNAAGGEYGIERAFAACITAADEDAKSIVEKLRSDVAGFCGDAPLHDDMTALIFKVRS
ncbi:MAG: SpoIIE family protein phosphatase [Spirochaetes bacterium]|nr:SpoIIE family protein phosphatase [Spirochaetota bacterium]